MTRPQQLPRRFLAMAAAAWAVSPVRPAKAEQQHYRLETDVWASAELIDQGGRTFSLGGSRAPLVVLKLWANWCPACVIELPSLAAMAADLGRNVEVILVSHPEYWANDQAAARRRALPFRQATFAPSTPPAMVRDALTEQGGAYAVPKSMVFRQRDRSIVLKRRGATDWADATITTQVRSCLA